MIAAAMGGEDMQKMLDYLQPPVHQDTFSDLDRAVMAAFGYKAD